MKRRVVITGMGAVSPIGNTAEEMWQSAREGRCGIGPITHFDTTNHKVKLAGEVKDLDFTPYLDKKELRRMDLFSQYAMVAAIQAWRDSGLDYEKIDPTRFGVDISSGIGGINTIETEYEPSEERDLILNFIKSSQRGIVRGSIDEYIICQFENVPMYQ